MSVRSQGDRELILIFVATLIGISVATIFAVALAAAGTHAGGMMGDETGWGNMMGYGGGWGGVLVVLALVTASAAVISALLLLLGPRAYQASPVPPSP